MPVFAVYDVATRNLVAWTRSVAGLDGEAAYQARGQNVVQLPDDAETGGIWNPATLRFDPRPPDAPRIITPLEFRMRFFEPERLAIHEAALTSAYLSMWLADLSAAQEVNLDDERTQAGVAALVAAGLLTQERAAEVLG